MFCQQLFFNGPGLSHEIQLDKSIPLLHVTDALSPTVPIEVATFQDARAACDAYIARYNLGGGNWTGGQLCEQGQSVGRVSYNGRVWDLNERCGYDPFGA